MLVAEFDCKQAYVRHGLASTAHWLNWHEFRNVSSFYDSDGTFDLHARLPPEVGAIVRRALERAGEAVRLKGDVSAETFREVPAHARQADALRLMAETYLAHDGEETGVGASADRVQVVVHIDQAILSEAAAAKAEGPHPLRARRRAGAGARHGAPPCLRKRL